MAEETKDGLVMTEIQERKDYASQPVHHRFTTFQFALKTVIFIRGV
jgi:hypothetical protein